MNVDISFYQLQLNWHYEIEFKYGRLNWNITVQESFFSSSLLLFFFSSSTSRRKAESIFTRFSELTKRPAAVKKALDSLLIVRNKVDAWVDKMPQARTLLLPYLRTYSSAWIAYSVLVALYKCEFEGNSIVQFSKWIADILVLVLHSWQS